jgi:hypothetical protein
LIWTAILVVLVVVVRVVNIETEPAEFMLAKHAGHMVAIFNLLNVGFTIRALADSILLYIF